MYGTSDPLVGHAYSKCFRSVGEADDLADVIDSQASALNLAWEIGGLRHAVWLHTEA